MASPAFDTSAFDTSAFDTAAFDLETVAPPPADYYSPRNPTVIIAPSIRVTPTIRLSLSVTPTITQ